MSASRKAWIALAISLVVIFVVYLTPWLIYWSYLSDVIHLPEPSAEVLTQEEKLQIWTSLGGEGVPAMRKMNPWSFIFDLATMASNGATSYDSPGFNHAGIYAMDHLSRELRAGAPIRDWHLTSAALAVWVTRNLDIDDVLSGLSESRSELLENDT